MGERKAVNKYYPPDWDPSKGGLDKYHGVHPLRERAAKLHLGIMVIRFEMPFNIWCGGCNNHIGMGVRYNAEKKQIGKYYTTPIWQFRMKCHLCDNYIEMHTDPKNFDYIVASGGRRKEERYDQESAECAAAHEPEERKRLGTDPMFKLEYKDKDEKVIEEAEPILDRLEDRQSVWKDDYSVNQNLRKRFRVDRKDDRIANKRLKEKAGFGIKMLPTSKTDKLTSSLVRFNTQKNTEKLIKKTEISSIFTESYKRTSLLTSLKDKGVKCRRLSDQTSNISDNAASLVKVAKRRKSAESTTSTSSSASSAWSGSTSSSTLPMLDVATSVTDATASSASDTTSLSKDFKKLAYYNAAPPPAIYSKQSLEEKEPTSSSMDHQEHPSSHATKPPSTRCSLVAGYSSSSEESAN